MVIKDPRNDRHFQPAPAGTVWLLTRTERHRNRFDDLVEAKAYVDPFQAIADLAGHVRRYWDRTCPVGQPPVRSEPPADDFEAVAAYYRDPTKLFVYETYKLDLVDVNLAHADRGDEHVLVRTHGEFVCVCGNVPGIGGFVTCIENGEEDDGGEFYRCCTCSRIIANDGTGKVVGRYVTEPHSNEPSVVDAARTASTALANLLKVWEGATQGPDGDEVEAGMSVGYPFKDEFAEVVANFANWTHQIRANVEGNPAGIADTVEHMRADVDAIRTDMLQSDYHGHNNSNSTFQQGMRGGLGGAIGDFGAAFHPGVAEHLAELLDAIAKGSNPGAIRRRAAWLCQTYEEARADNRDL